MVRSPEQRFDVAIVGAGIVGLAHAFDATERGLSVAVIERDSAPRGASVRNFGHAYVAAQSRESFEDATRARRRWLRLASAAGIHVVESGTLLVARWPEELRVVSEFAAMRDTGARVLSADETLARAPVSPAALGALWTPLDVRVDPRTAVPSLAAWLASRGVTFLWQTSALGVEPGLVATSRGDVEAEVIVVAAGHDVDRLFPRLAEEEALLRCTLQMLRVAAPSPRRIEPALATGLALLRYSGFGECPSRDELRARYAAERPELLEHEVNLLVTQQPDGDLLLGDTHRYALASDPFRDERLDELLLREGSALLGVDELTVRERWLGVYAWASGRESLVAAPSDGVRVVAVTSGIGMTTALGLAPRVLDDLLDRSHAYS